MTERYRDFYNCTASITSVKGAYRLIVRTERGRLVRKQTFKTHRGAVRAMNNDSDSTMELVQEPSCG